MSYSQLKSGTDVRGVAEEFGGKTVNLTDQAVYDITAAFVVWFVNRFEKPSNELKIAVGHDSRVSADRISNQVKKALINAGITVLDCSLASTPAMFMTTVDLGADAAIQITASHHPSDRRPRRAGTRRSARPPRTRVCPPPTGAAALPAARCRPALSRARA